MPRIIANGARSILRVTRHLGGVSRGAFLALLVALSWVVATPALAVTGYTDNADGTVTDQATGLIWKRCAEGQTWTGSICSGTPTPYTWSQANSLTGTVWRLPSIGELETIVDTTAYNPAINASAFPNAPSSTFWSATADANNANNGLYVSFVYGNTSTLNKANTFFARLVSGTASTSGGGTTGGGAGNLSIVPTLQAGWNLLGNSLSQAFTVATLYGDSTVVNSVWKWDSAVSGWQFYTPSLTAAALQAYATSKGYGVLSAINPGQGFWVNAKIKTTLATQTGTPFSLAAINLATGWNLVATGDDISPSELNRRLSATPPSPGVTPMNFTTLWAWDNPTSNWYFYAPSLDANGTLTSYVASTGYLDFTQRGKTLGNGTGFWVNSTTSTVAIAPSLTIGLTNNVGVAVTALSGSAPTTVTATVTDAAGAAVSNAIVTFSTDATVGTITPATALTNTAGVATVTISPAGTAGASTVTATTQVGTAAVTGSKGYTVAAAAVPSVTVALTNNVGGPVTNIASGTPATVKATVKDAAGAAVAGAIVTFSTDPNLGTIAPISATALTDAAGVATATLNTASLTAAGAATITATSQVGITPVTGAIGYSVGAAVVTITPPAFVLNPLSAFGTTGVSVTVSSNGIPVTTPQTVSFASSCASNGKAVLTANVATLNGIATASYRDNGCAGNDVVTASVSGITSAAATLTVTPPTTGSIQYVSATPASITLKGMGGAGRQESSQIIFKVVDTGGNPIGGKTVSFSLSNAAGGAGLTTPTAISDPTTGQVVVGVNSGTVSTPVRVIASTVSGTATLITQSDQLSITTGIPDQDSFSLSASRFNIEGWSIDGQTTTITARLADHFNNPVPDGTAVVFMTEGGMIGDTSQPIKPVGSCTTVASTCAVTLTSQSPRVDGRVTVLAYAVGTESFTDLNGNGLADQPPAVPTEMIDAAGVSTDMGEAFLDYNEDGVRDPLREPYIDFNGNGSYDGPDGIINTMICDHSVAPGSSATACPTQQYRHVRGSLVVVFSGSDAVTTINNGATIALASCVSPTGPGASSTFTVTVVDLHGNAMPVGTTVAFSTDNGKITSDATYTVPNTTGCRTGSATCPASVGSPTFGDISVTMKTDATMDKTTLVCSDVTGSSGIFTVKVTTPNGMVTANNMRVTD